MECQEFMFWNCWASPSQTTSRCMNMSRFSYHHMWTGIIRITNAEISWNEPSSCSNCFSGRHCFEIDLCSSRLIGSDLQLGYNYWSGSFGLCPQKERSVFVFVCPSRSNVVLWACWSLRKKTVSKPYLEPRPCLIQTSSVSSSTVHQGTNCL